MDSQELLTKPFTLKQLPAKLRQFCISTCLKKFALLDAWNVQRQATDLTITNPPLKRGTLTMSNPQSPLSICTSTLERFTKLMEPVTSMKFTKTLEKLSCLKFLGLLDPVDQENPQLDVHYALAPT